MLYYFVAAIYVLLQQGKGGDMASAFGGGGSQTAFGARQGATVLSKATAVLGGLFMIGAIALAWLGNTSGSLLRGLDAPARPAAPAPVTPAPSTATPPATPTAPAPSPGTPAGAPPAAGAAQPTPPPIAPSNQPVEKPKP